MDPKFIKITRFAWLAATVIGCSDAGPDGGNFRAEPAHPLVIDRPDDTAVEFDFGNVLARGQVLRHDFSLTNRTGRPMRLLKGEPLTPCCSAIEALPSFVPVGSTVLLPIAIKAGTQSGMKRLTFLVQTDSPEQASFSFIATMMLVAETEVRAIPERSIAPTGSGTGRRRFDVICRRIGPEGRGSPDAVAVSPTVLEAKLAGPPNKRAVGEGSIEESSEVEVVIPGSAESGTKQAELTLRWEDGHTFRHPFTWEVRPRIELSPRSLVLNRSGLANHRSVYLRGEDRPFRILRIESPPGLTLEAPTNSSTFHEIRLVIDDSLSSKGGSFDVKIKTDHPDQREVVLSVLVLAAKEEPLP